MARQGLDKRGSAVVAFCREYQWMGGYRVRPTVRLGAMRMGFRHCYAGPGGDGSFPLLLLSVTLFHSFRATLLAVLHQPCVTEMSQTPPGAPPSGPRPR